MYYTQGNSLHFPLHLLLQQSPYGHLIIYMLFFSLHYLWFCPVSIGLTWLFITNTRPSWSVWNLLMVKYEAKLESNGNKVFFKDYSEIIRINLTNVCLFLPVGFTLCLLDTYLPWGRSSIALFIPNLNSKCRWLHTLAILSLEKEEAGSFPALSALSVEEQTLLPCPWQLQPAHSLVSILMSQKNLQTLLLCYFWEKQDSELEVSYPQKF
jgi:hypothetical protein